MKSHWQHHKIVRTKDDRDETMIKQQRVFPQNLWITVLATQG